MLASNINWTEECVEVLAMSILILNTNIHSDKIPKSLKLTKAAYVKTNRQILNNVVSHKFLNDLYDRIAMKEFES